LVATYTTNANADRPRKVTKTAPHTLPPVSAADGARL
jgi:hypothetical protein